MTARVASPLPARYNLSTFPKTPPNSLKLSIPFLQSLHPLPSHLPSLPSKPKVKRVKGSTIERGDFRKKNGGFEKTEINVSVIAVSSLEQSGSSGEAVTNRCKQCRRALYSGDEEQPVERNSGWALNVLLEDQPEASTSSTSMVIRTIKKRFRVRRQSVSIKLDESPLLQSSKPEVDDTTPVTLQPRRRSSPTPSPPPPSPPRLPFQPHKEPTQPIPSSVQLTTFSLPHPDPSVTPTLRQRHSSPLSGRPPQSTPTAQPARRKSCPPGTPLRIQVLEWRMVQCGKLAGVRARNGSRGGGEGTAGRWEAS